MIVNAPAYPAFFFSTDSILDEVTPVFELFFAWYIIRIFSGVSLEKHKICMGEETSPVSKSIILR
jgi:hypothetical protein